MRSFLNGTILQHFNGFIGGGGGGVSLDVTSVTLNWALITFIHINICWDRSYLVYYINVWPI